MEEKTPATDAFDGLKVVGAEDLEEEASAELNYQPIEDKIAYRYEMENDFFDTVIYKTEYAKIDNGEVIAYRSYGTGNINVLLVHGHLTCSVNMEKLMGSFNEKEVRVIAPCLRGQGYSSYISTIKDFRDLAKDLQLFMLKNFKDETFYVMGHSMGGAVAMHLALLMP